MARVTKINVGGTNYDIAHEGELKNSGFEVVTALPTTNLFVGRQVMYNGKLYVYNGSQWVNVNKPYEANLLWGGRNIAGSFSPVDAAMTSELSANVMAFPRPNGISIEYSRDGGVTWLDYEATDAQKINIFTTNISLYCGKSDPDGLTATVGYQLRITFTPTACSLDTMLNKIIMQVSVDGASDCWCTFKGLRSKNVVDENEDDIYYDTIVNKAYIYGWPSYNVLNFGEITTASSYATTPQYNDTYYRLRLIFGYDSVYDSTPYAGLRIKQLKFFGRGRYVLPSNLAANNHLYAYDWQQNALFPAKVASKEVINFDVNNIEPTQTGNVTKTSTWLWQYLVQGINWLKANNVRLSAYNTKVAALEQADTDNNASIQSVSTDLTELSNGLAAVARSGSYNDLTDTPTLAAVATSGDYNDLSNLPTIPSSFADLNGNIDGAKITEGSIANSKLANSSMTLNGINVSLGDTAILPWKVEIDGTTYSARLWNNWLWIYNGGWIKKFYLLSQEPIQPIQPTNVVQITSFANLDWYNEQVSEYEIDSNTTFELLNGKVFIASQLIDCSANQLTLNLYPIIAKDYVKGSLDNVISDLKSNNFAVFVENDIDTILTSGSNFCMRIKISKVPTYKAIIECYVAK